MIRFDAETGRLEGTSLPSVAEVIAFMKADGMKARTCLTWDSELNCGCAIGALGLMQDRHAMEAWAGGGEGMVVSPVVAEMLPAPRDVVWDLIRGFDNGPEFLLEDQKGRPGVEYGQAVREAVTAASLWFPLDEGDAW